MLRPGCFALVPFYGIHRQDRRRATGGRFLRALIRLLFGEQQPERLFQSLSNGVILSDFVRYAAPPGRGTSQPGPVALL